MADSYPTISVGGVDIRTVPPRPGFGQPILAEAKRITDQNELTRKPPLKISDVVHPSYDKDSQTWRKWRLCYEGGDCFLEEFLREFSYKEHYISFDQRKEMTPVPAFAKAALLDVKNSIYQSLNNIVRQGGPASYIESCFGHLGGVDLNDGTMNWFLGNRIIPELLPMAQVGVFVDAPALSGPTVADKGLKHPYLYTYRREDRRAWTKTRKSYTHLLLRDWVDVIDPTTGLTIDCVANYRLLWINDQGYVSAALFDEEGNHTSTQQLNIPEIPFVDFEISHSLLSDIANHQIALLNLESSDVAYGLKSNITFYTEQRDTGYTANHLKTTNLPPEVKEAVAGLREFSDPAHEEDIEVGNMNGRVYGKGLERPGFIAPPADPLRVSMEKQKGIKNDIRQLLNLSLSNVQSVNVSAEAMGIELQGLESGLSAIGLELEHGERRIAYFWSLYEGNREPTTITYPSSYSLETDEERLDKATQLAKHIYTVPSQTFRKAVLRKIANTLVGSSLTRADMTAMIDEINNADVPTADPTTITKLVESGLLSHELAAKILGHPSTDLPVALKEYSDRLTQISQAQSSKNPAARGVPDLAPDPKLAAAAEKMGTGT
jgi:hypothetical protein